MDCSNTVLLILGRWEARIGVCPKRHLYLGVYATEDLAALHYDRALVRLKGKSATTNFPIRNYSEEATQNELMEKVRDLLHLPHCIMWCISFKCCLWSVLG